MPKRKRFTEPVNLSNAVLVHYEPGDDLPSRFEQTLEDLGWEHAVVLSAIGSVRDVVVRFPNAGIDLPLTMDKTVKIEEEGPFDLLSLEGNVVPMEGKPVIHLHVMVTRPDGSVLGGHLFEATVFTAMEVVMAEMQGSKVIKEESNVTGLKEMRLP